MRYRYQVYQIHKIYIQIYKMYVDIEDIRYGRHMRIHKLGFNSILKEQTVLKSDKFLVLDLKSKSKQWWQILEEMKEDHTLDNRKPKKITNQLIDFNINIIIKFPKFKLRTLKMF